MGEEDPDDPLLRIGEIRGSYTTGAGSSQDPEANEYWRAMSVLVRDVPEEKQGETVDLIRRVIELAKEKD